MKTFDDLQFNAHEAGIAGFKTQAKMTFDNGYGISVITGDYAYTSETEPYECAVIGKRGGIDYETGITDDVIGYCTAEKVTEVMKQIQELN